MPFDPEDHRLTAYALGELGAADREAIEAALRDDPEAVAFVAGVRETARLLADELAHESAAPAGLDAIRRVAIERRIAAPTAVLPAQKPTRRIGKTILALAVAAGLFGVAIGLLLPSVQSARAGRLDPALYARAESEVTSTRPATPPAHYGLQSAPAAPSRIRARSKPMLGRDQIERMGMPGMQGMMGSGMGMSGMQGMMGSGMQGEKGPIVEQQVRRGVLAPNQRTSQVYYRDAQNQNGRSRQPIAEAESASKAKLDSVQDAANGKVVADPVNARPVAEARAGEIRSEDKKAEVDFFQIAEATKKEATDPNSTTLGLKDAPAARPAHEPVQVVERLAEGDVPAARERARVEREAYARFYDNPFVNVVPGRELSTFSIDVDTAAYANVRRFLTQGLLPPVDAVRIEELINYFTYDDPAPKGDVPFSVNVEIAACPWSVGHRLARIGLKGKEIEPAARPMSNFVFLIDVSGSMGDLNKLPLLKAGMKLLVEGLRENDRVAIVTYANGTRVALPSTSCDHKAEILAALDNLQAGGGTNGGAGIDLAYQQAAAHFIKGGTNRVILGTDGDFNVGVTKDELLARSEERARGGIFLSVLGFGEGNLQEAFMEQLADKGNGNYSYIDTIDEARKVLVRQMSATLDVIAKDVKIQVEFNPVRVAAYRLIGYENRVMANEDFRNDKKDAGEIGAGHSVTALYELVPVGADATTNVAAADRPLKYRQQARADASAVGPGNDGDSAESLTVFLRYKQPDGDKATEISKGVRDDGRDLGRTSADLKFSAAVAGFGMLLRESPYKGTLTYPAVREIAGGAIGDDKHGDRKEFLGLVDRAKAIAAP